MHVQSYTHQWPTIFHVQLCMILSDYCFTAERAVPMAIASSPAGLMAQRYVEIYKETKKQHHVQCCVVSL